MTMDLKRNASRESMTSNGKMASMFFLSQVNSSFIYISIYSVALPNMAYEVVSNIVDLPSNTSYWLNNSDFKNNSNISTTTVAADNEKSFKRKLSENEENEDESKTALPKN